MNLVEYSTAAAFLHRAKSFLAANEAKNNLLFSTALILARTSTTRSLRYGFYTVEDEGRIICAALNVVGKRLLFSFADEPAALFLGVELAGRKIKIGGVIGPEPGTGLFCAAVNETAPSSTLQPRSLQGIFQLETLISKPPIGGQMRLALKQDLPLAISWTKNFVSENALTETPAESEESARMAIEAKQLFIWEDPQPVAMAGFGGITPQGVRVNMVYTEPSARKKGYARTLVQLLSQKLLESDHKFCVLLAENKNQAANHIYESLGYNRIGDFTVYTYDLPSSQ